MADGVFGNPPDWATSPAAVEDARRESARQAAAAAAAQDGPRSLGNPFVTAGASIFVVGFLVAMLVMLLAGVSGIPYLNADTALADRAYIHANCATCQGKKGDKGTSGTSGASGISGATGAKGQQGDPGRNAICLPNPDFPCAKGQKGDVGGDGPSGPTGVGTQGIKGDSGPSGPSGQTGAKGDTGETGATGTTGADGPSGPPGPPFSGAANFTSVNVTGPVLCAVPIDQSCLGPGGCFNFTLCTIVAEGVYVQGVTLAPVLKVLFLRRRPTTPTPYPITTPPPHHPTSLLFIQPRVKRWEDPTRRCLPPSKWATRVRPITWPTLGDGLE